MRLAPLLLALYVGSVATAAVLVAPDKDRAAVGNSAVTGSAPQQSEPVRRRGCLRPYVTCSTGGHLIRFRGRGAEWYAHRARVLRRALVRVRHDAIPSYWLALHNCEQPGAWRHAGPEAEFSGGLGIRRSSWTAYAPRGLPSVAYYATPWQQIEVARRIMRVGNGWGGQCHAVAARIIAIEL